MPPYEDVMYEVVKNSPPRERVCVDGPRIPSLGMARNMAIRNIFSHQASICLDYDRFVAMKAHSEP